MKLKLESTNPDVFAAVLAVAQAYQHLWEEVREHPADRQFVSGMISYVHAANVIPHLDKL